MPQGLPNLLDLMKIEKSLAYELVEENLSLSPELELIPADTIDGTSMELTVRTGLPTVGFRNFNEGTDRSKSAYETRMFQTHELSGRIAVDAALLASRKQGTEGRFLMTESAGFVEAAIRKVSSQFYYGVKQDAKGFIGLIAQMLADADHEVDVTGSSNKSSVFFLSRGRAKTEFLFGNNRTINMDAAWKEETVQQGGKDMKAWTNWLTGNVGMRLANKHSCVRIKNIGTAANKTLTPEHMHAAYNKFIDLGLLPDVILMSGRSREQLRQTLITPENPNPSAPTSFEGVPIRITSNISNAEII